MSLVDKTTAELEIDLAEFAIISQKLSSEKQEIQGELAQLNAKVKGVHLPDIQWRTICKHRALLVKQIADKEIALSELKSKKTEISAVIRQRRIDNPIFGPSRVAQLTQLRDKYHGFSMDSNNHQKAREVAWKFSQELGAILKEFFTSAPASPRETGS